MQTGRIRQCIMYRMAQRCVDIMNVKNVETGFWRYRQDRSRSMGTPLQYRQIHRKTLFLTDSFFPLSMKNALEHDAPGHFHVAYDNYCFAEITVIRRVHPV